MSSVIPSVAMLSSFMALLLAAFLFSVPSRNRVANALLALFLVITAIDISAWFMESWWLENPTIGSFGPVLAAFQMPLFTGFIWFSCFQEQRLRLRDSLHFLPSFLVLFFVINDTAMPWLWALLELQYFVYICVAIFTLWRFDRLLKARFVQRSPSWRWLALLIASSVFAHGLYIVRTVLSSSLPVDISSALQAFAALLILAITVWIAFQALLNPFLFRGSDQILMSAAREMSEHSANEHERLIVFMEKQLPYLDPDLSLARLARRSGIAAKELSTLINQRHGSHFFDFINRYRIDHAKALLVETEQSVTEIIYASGFNAKSSFNTAFRKHMGTTPSAYRRDHAKE